MDGYSLNVVQEQLNKLKELFPEVIAEDKIDWERLRATLGEDIYIPNERYVLNWAGKSDAFRTLQTGTTATLAPVKDESINFDTTDNIFIEGENPERPEALIAITNLFVHYASFSSRCTYRPLLLTS